MVGRTRVHAHGWADIHACNARVAGAVNNKEAADPIDTQTNTQAQALVTRALVVDTTDSRNGIDLKSKENREKQGWVCKG